MKNTFVIAASLLAITTSAQITITQTDMPSVGDTLRVSFAASTNNIDHTLSGPNYLWDFSTLVPTAQQVFEYSAPTAIPFIFTATYGVLNPSPDSLPGIGAVPTNFYDYFKNGSSGYRQVGSSFEYPPIGSFAIPIIYTSSDYVYEFPLNYNDIDSSDAAYGFQLPGFGYFGQDRHRETRADGWGTLTTPYGTFQVLRVRSVVDATDTISLDSFGIALSIPRPQLIEYKWLAQGKKIPILEVEAQVFANVETVTNVIYRDSIRSNVFQVGVNELATGGRVLSIYPNPASDQVTLTWQLAQSSRVRFEVTDVNGRLVLAEEQGQQTAGTRQTVLNVQQLPAGVYSVRLFSNGIPGAAQLLIRQ